MYKTKQQLPVPEPAEGFGWFAQAVQLAKYKTKRSYNQGQKSLTHLFEMGAFIKHLIHVLFHSV